MTGELNVRVKELERLLKDLYVGIGDSVRNPGEERCRIDKSGVQISKHTDWNLQISKNVQAYDACLRRKIQKLSVPRSP